MLCIYIFPVPVFLCLMTDRKSLLSLVLWSWFGSSFSGLGLVHQDKGQFKHIFMTNLAGMVKVDVDVKLPKYVKG